VVKIFGFALFLCMEFDFEDEWYEGGGVKGGRQASASVCFGVPGLDSHMNGIAPEAPP
jgi:hypothetical protein